MHISEDSTRSTSRFRAQWSRHSLHDEAELVVSDRRAGHDYLPMDVYVDSAERRLHFSAWAVLERFKKDHPASRRRS
jgi:hypothetical protein